MLAPGLQLMIDSKEHRISRNKKLIKPHTVYSQAQAYLYKNPYYSKNFIKQHYVNQAKFQRLH